MLLSNGKSGGRRRKAEDAGNGRLPLRIGVMIGAGRRFENWELQLLDRLLADPRFSLAAMLVHPKPFSQHRPNGLVGLVERFDRALFARQARYHTQHFSKAEPALARIALDADDAPARIHALELDVVLRHIPAGLRDDLTRDLPFGVWALSFIDAQYRETNWTGIAEVLSDAPDTRLRLSVDRGKGHPEEQIADAAFNLKFSAARNAAFMKEKAVLLIMRELSRLADTRQLACKKQKDATDASARPPGYAKTAAYIVRLVSKAAGLAYKTLRRKAHMETAVWTLYSGRGTIDDFDPSVSVEIPPSQTSIKADPFLFRHDGETYVFYENYGVGDSHAHIAVGKLNGQEIEPIGIALDGNEHLSFPFVFRSGSDIFMMPETHQRRRIEIWRAVSFPLVWEPYSTALEGWSAADSTLFKHHGKWWLLSNLSEHHAFEDHCSALYAFEVDGPKLSSVVPHRRNPVVIGSTVARNAGRVFTRQRRLFRPSQNNSYGIYGYGLNIMEIEELTRDTYRETCLRTITPDFKPGLIGCHHFDAYGDRYILDARVGG